MEAFWKMDAMKLDIGGFGDENGRPEAGIWGPRIREQGGSVVAGEGFGGQGGGHTGGGETRKQLSSHSRSLPS